MEDLEETSEQAQNERIQNVSEYKVKTHRSIDIIYRCNTLVIIYDRRKSHAKINHKIKYLGITRNILDIYKENSGV